MGDIGKYIVIGGAVLIVAVIFLVIIKTRNGFVVLQNRVKNQLAQIDVQLKRRYDLIPNLLETAKGYANFERSTLEAVVKARQSAMAAADFDQAAAANGKLQAALRRLFAVSEAYPELKANANFMQLQSELSDTENKIALSRQFITTPCSNTTTPSRCSRPVSSRDCAVFIQCPFGMRRKRPESALRFRRRI